MIFSQNFAENVVILLLTAVITGFLIPYILKRIDQTKLDRDKERDERKLREQKEFEAALARQTNIIKAQAQLLESLADLLWEYQLAAILVSFYVPNPELYATAVKKYQEDSARLFSKIRAEISKALRLTTLETYQKLKDSNNKSMDGTNLTKLRYLNCLIW